MMTSSVPTMDAVEDYILVSNGGEFFRIPSDDLPAAQADGFYRPHDRGMTIVSDGESPFEIPIADLEWAKTNGFRDLLNPASGHAETQVAKSQTPLIETDVPASPRVNVKEGLDRLTDPREEEIEQEQLLEESQGWRRLLLVLQFWIRERRAQLSRQLGGTGISVLVHFALLLLLASFALIEDKPEAMGLVITAAAPDDVIDEVVIDVTPIDVSEPTDVTESEPPPESAEVPMELSVEAPDLSSAIVGAAIKPPTKPAAKPSSEVGAKGVGKPNKPTIFGGSQMSATNYVFVIDNSNSMTKGRFETALHELMITINQLTPKQRFYVIFYSDTAYPMMHPRPALKLVAATDINKRYLYEWLKTVPLCLRTNGKAALNAAFKLNPDVIYVLGDGAFSDKAGQYFTARPHERITVHTRGMEVKPQEAATFRKLAKANRGTYKDVAVSPEGARMAKQYPRPRNNFRGPVWGLTLPLKK